MSSPTLETTFDANEFRKILGHYPTGVCVIAAPGEPVPCGMVVGSFTSVSLDPPLVGFFPDKKSTSWPLIEQAGRFSVNVMAQEQADVCRSVGAKGADKFAGVDYSLSANGLPIIGGALAAIECDIYSVTEAGDHWFVLGRVLSMVASEEGSPMLFHKGRYGTFA